MTLLPASPREFEKLVCDCVACKYSIPFALYGRNGQKQYGADALSADRTIIVQCKYYDPNDNTAINRLIKAVKKDFTEACERFPLMNRFIVATSLMADTEVQDVFYSLQESARSNKREVVVETLFWGDIEDYLDVCKLNMVNETYAEDFEQPLFLHKGNVSVSLRNLFVAQEYHEISEKDCTDDKSSNLLDRIGIFLNDLKQKVMIIEGDAGCGKTSLVQALCWHDREEDTVSKQVLNGRPLVAVRLRDLDKNQISGDKGLLPAIMNNLCIPGYRVKEQKKCLLSRFPRAILVLDGFDELCIIEGIQRYDQLLYQLTRERLDGWHIIVTSRPNYIPRSIDFPHTILELRHFSAQKRAEWIERYTAKEFCGQNICADLEEYILSGKEEGVCDTPMTLYLLAAGNVEAPERENQWRLYHRLFSGEIANRQYDEADHPAAGYRNVAYRMAEEIAYRMYSNRNTRLYLDNNELEAIIEELHRDDSLQDSIEGYVSVKQLAGRILGLCAYWKVLGQRGVVEFYHNNIRDFFLSEKIYNSISEIYSNPQMSKEEKTISIISFFRDKFYIGQLEPRVCEFIYCRAKYEWETKQGVPIKECTKMLCPSVFQLLLTDGRIYKELNEKYILPSIICIIACTVRFFQAIREPKRQEINGRHVWWENVQEINDASLLSHVNSEVFRAAQRVQESAKGPESFFPGQYGDFAQIDLSGASLQSMILNGVSLQHAKLDHVNLRKANLKDSNLQDTALCGSNLEYTDLQNADLQRSEMRLSNLQNANLRNANMENVDLSGANMRFSCLIEANLLYANLSGVELSGSHLASAILPDGYSNSNEKKQRDHLRAMKIKGLVM